MYIKLFPSKYFASFVYTFFFTVLCTPQFAECIDATNFDPTTVSITSESTIAVGTIIAWPAASNPADITKWLECNGQTIPSNSQYDRLRSVLGSSKVPNYNSQFLRGTTIASQAGQQVADSIRAHSHDIDPHQHTVSGSASGQSYGGSIGSESVSGWANGQNYSGSIGSESISGWADGQSYSGTTGGAYYEDTVTDYGGNSYGTGSPFMGWTQWAPGTMNEYTRGAYTGGSNYSGWTSGGSISGWTSGTTYSGSTSGGSISGWTSGTSYGGTTSGGTITGYTNFSGGGATHETGGAETAPIHTKVRYFIRAIL